MPNTETKHLIKETQTGKIGPGPSHPRSRHPRVGILKLQGQEPCAQQSNRFIGSISPLVPYLLWPKGHGNCVLPGLLMDSPCAQQSCAQEVAMGT